MGKTQWSIKARLKIGAPSVPCTSRCRILHTKPVSCFSLPSWCQVPAIHWSTSWESCNAPSDDAQAGELQRVYREARIQSRHVGVNQDRSESASVWVER